MIDWAVTKETENYDVKELDLGEFILSITTLYPHKATIGHWHDSPEYIVLTCGKAVFLVDLAVLSMECGDHMLINTKEYHRVFNSSDESALILGIYKKGISITHGSPG